jgi:tetratricopeptide (TPR) repeat protein
MQAGDLARCEDLARAALAERPDTLAVFAAAIATNSIAVARAHAGEFDTALEIIDAALRELPETAEDRFSLEGLHSAATYWALMAGDVERAKAEARATLDLGRQLGNPSALAMGLLTFGYVCWRDDPDAALSAIDEGAELARRGAFDVNLAGALQAAALIHAARGQISEALGHLREGIRYEHDIGDRVTTASILLVAVNVLGGTGHYELAATCAGIVTVGPLAGLGFQVNADGFERGRAAAEHVLGIEEFRVIGARTGAMTFDDACVHVLGELDRILAGLDDA